MMARLRPRNLSGQLASVGDTRTVTVTDTQTGKVNVYTNPSGRFASIADVEAF